MTLEAIIAGMSAELRGRVVVLSPHLDDAVFSLGAALAAAARRGAGVTIVTPFAGDPGSSAPASWWDRRAGFETEGEAARARREEDRAATACLGATPVWLPFADASYVERADADTVWAAVEDAAGGADVVLAPGFPNAHPDHAWLTRALLERGLDADRIGLYVEQPYARRRSEPPLTGGNEPWMPLPAKECDRRAKRRASLCYRSQLPLLAPLPFYGRVLLVRIAAYERRRGGERVAWIQSEPRARQAGASAAAGARRSRTRRTSSSSSGTDQAQAGR